MPYSPSLAPHNAAHQLPLLSHIKMAPIQNYDYNFPYFPIPPPHNPLSPPKVTPPPHNSPSPPKVAPPHHPMTPPPPPTFPARAPPPPAAKPPSHSIPPPSPIIKPPPHPISPPPPPHIVPTPPPPPGHHSTVIVVVFVSLGGLFFLAFLSVTLCCFIKKRKKKMVQETKIVNLDEHLKVQEAIIPGPHGAQAVVLSIEEDVHFQEEIKKNEKVNEGSHIRSAQEHPQALDIAASTSGSSHHYLKNKA